MAQGVAITPCYGNMALTQVRDNLIQGSFGLLHLFSWTLEPGIQHAHLLRESLLTTQEMVPLINSRKESTLNQFLYQWLRSLHLFLCSGSKHPHSLEFYSSGFL